MQRAWDATSTAQYAPDQTPPGTPQLTEFDILESCSPGHEIGNEQIEPLTDNKTVRLPGAAPGWKSPLQRRRSGAKRRTSGAVASNPSGRSIQIWSNPPISRLDRQLGGRSYMAIRQLVKVRTAGMSEPL